MKKVIPCLFIMVQLVTKSIAQNPAIEQQITTLSKQK
jgi:hypothetical protein